MFGLDLADYDTLFAEKLDLLLQDPGLGARSPGRVGTGRALTGQGVYPRPAQDPLPIWVGVGGTPESFVRAGLLGLPLMVAIIGGEPRQFAPLVDLYRRAGAEAGHPPETLQVGLHVLRLRRRQRPGPPPTPSTPGGSRCSPRSPGSAGSRRRRGPSSTPPAVPTARSSSVTRTPSPPSCARVSEQLGGVDRVSLQMTNPRLAHADLLRGIELLGTEVAPQVADTAADS